MKKIALFILALSVLFPSLAAASPFVVQQGGTGTSTLPAGQLLVGNGKGAVTGTSSPTVDSINTSSTTATSTFSGNAYVKGNLRVDGNFYAPVSLVSSGNATINGVLTVTGVTQFADGAVGTPSVTFTADTNTGMYRGGNDILRFVTAGADRLTINDSGNVGIGTTAPSSILHLSADTGIAGASPIGLTVESNTVSTGNWTSDGIMAQILFNSKDATGGAGTRGAIKSVVEDTSGGDFGLSFYTTTNGATGIQEQMRINNTGNVGIGTTSPATTLSVGGNGYLTGGLGIGAVLGSFNTKLYVMAGTSGTGQSAGLIYGSTNNGTFTDPTGRTRKNATLVIGSNYATNSGTVLNVESAAGDGLLLVDAAGNVGIGTTNPQYKLEVNGSASSTNYYLPYTTSSALGVVYKGTDRFMHNFNYGNNGTVTTVGYNTFIGVNAGNFTMGSTATQTNHASYNTAVGQNALANNTTGYNNTANGVNALISNTTGSQNTANGLNALTSNTTGYQNTANGAYALYSNTTGNYNTANGLSALYSNTTGYYNTANGVSALRSNTTGYYNTANGLNALYYNQSATNTTALGFEAGKGTANYSNQGGVYVGFQTGYSAGTGSDYNSFVGYESGYNTIDGTYNTALGYRALYNATSSDNAVAIGREALYNHLNSQYNTAIGYRALYTATSSEYNTAVGYNALATNTTGHHNTAYGVDSLYANTTGFNSTALGDRALYLNTTANYVVAIGDSAANGTGYYSNQGGVYVGYVAGYNAGTGSDYNTMVGYAAGYGVTTGANNILLGRGAGYSGTNLTTGSNNIIIGNNIGATSSDMTRGLNIGNLIFGTGLDGSGTTLSSGNVGIGTTNPSQKLEINGGMRLNTATAKPTCDSSVRGTFWFTHGGAGVKDAVEVCAKDAADAYAWRTIY